MKIQDTKTVADLVTEDIQTAHIFRKYGIDFCCGGSIPVKQAAAKAKISFLDLEKELLGVKNKPLKATKYYEWELDYLADHIVNKHHRYILENIPIIIAYASKVVQVHAIDYPELIQIQRLFSEVSIDLTGHLKKEENVVFPFIKRLTEAGRSGKKKEKPSFDSLENPIKIMEEDHEEAGVVFKKIKVLSGNFKVPEDACDTFEAFYAKLEEFEKDLHQHVHLENNILFPKALKLEKELFDLKSEN